MQIPPCARAIASTNREADGSVREPELAHLPWDAAAKRAFVERQFAAQDAHYRQHYPGATRDVVEVDGEPGGRLYVHRGPSDTRIMDIAIAPPSAAAGWGRSCSRRSCADAGGQSARASCAPVRAILERI